MGTWQRLLEAWGLASCPKPPVPSLSHCLHFHLHTQVVANPTQHIHFHPISSLLRSQRLPGPSTWQPSQILPSLFTCNHPSTSDNKLLIPFSPCFGIPGCSRRLLHPSAGSLVPSSIFFQPSPPKIPLQPRLRLRRIQPRLPNFAQPTDQTLASYCGPRQPRL